MKSFINLERLLVPMSVVSTIGQINQFKGKQDLYRQQSPQVLDALRQVAVIQSTEASNSIEGITISSSRLRQLMDETATPRDRSEGEIAGYRDVLATIYASYEHIPVNPSVIRQFHRDLYTFSSFKGGSWKSSDSEIVEVRPDGTRFIRFMPVSAFDTPRVMDELCHALTREIEEGKNDPLIVAAAFVLDFLCIHPFSDGNGRMVRLLTLLVLYKLGYEVGRFISLEKLIEKTKESYYETLYRSSINWREGKHDLLPWLEYFLGVLLAAYRQFEERVGNITSYKGSKSKRIEEAIRRFVQQFTISDLENICPDISRPTIYRVLKELKDQKLIEPIEMGRNAKWRKIRGN